MTRGLPLDTTTCLPPTTSVAALPTHAQATFLDAASTPKEVRLLHAPTLTSAFRLLPAQLLITAAAARRSLRHSVSVASAIPVQRYLKVEMAGLAVDQAAGARV